MKTRDLQEPLKVFRLVGTTLDRQKIDELNEEPRLTVAGFAHDINELFQSRQKSIVTDAQQRPTRNVANAGSFNHQCRRFSFGKSTIPIKIVLRDKSIFSCAPWHHRRHPGAIVESDRTDLDWLEEE